MIYIIMVDIAAHLVKMRISIVSNINVCMKFDSLRPFDCIKILCLNFIIAIKNVV